MWNEVVCSMFLRSLKTCSIPLSGTPSSKSCSWMCAGISEFRVYILLFSLIVVIDQRGAYRRKSELEGELKLRGVWRISLSKGATDGLLMGQRF